MRFLEWAGRHPILTIIAMMILFDGLTECITVLVK